MKIISRSIPSGLALYWVISNVITIVMQYFTVGGWGGLVGAKAGSGAGRALKQRIAQVEKSPSRITAMEADVVDSTATEEEEPTTYGGGYTTGISRVKHQPKRGKHHKRG